MAEALHMFESSEDKSDLDRFLVDETVEETQPIAAGTLAVSWRDIAGDSNEEEEDFHSFSDIEVQELQQQWKSTSRFGKLKGNIDTLQEALFIKNLSKTCWIGRAESIRAVFWVGTLDEVQEIDKDILASSDVMHQTGDAMIRIREDDLGLDGIVTAAVEKCNSFGIDAEYEFSKMHRPRRPPRHIDENTDNANIPLFNQEIFKVLDLLVSDIDDTNNYFSNIFLPQKIAKCTEEDAENFCATFPGNLKDPTSKRVVPRIYRTPQIVYSEDNVDADHSSVCRRQ
ncbi:Hypothetical predicted protein [Paramuricea clavata]|uniref:Uncharacterized protein n=1 Tax=Paramuricea clavata TaxID=317549 RepID=A0A7D9L0U5_PARCT|nr:Hypothetical predicted protein [Paramuricea clavata]